MNIKEYIYSVLNEYENKFGLIPKEFSWAPKYLFSKELQNNFLFKKEYEKIREKISKPKHQKILNTCWAIAFATTVNDAFLIKKIIDWNPNISATYIVSKFSNIGNCSRGCIIKLGNEAINLKEGFASESCIDYSWCIGNKDCDNSNNIYKTIDYYNYNIPSPGCYRDDVEKFSYKISKLFYITYNNLSFRYTNKKSLLLEQLVKIHIIMRAPVILCFPVFLNFFDKFWEIEENKGIYFEDTSSKLIDFHSVCVVGWGYTTIKNKSKDPIPYWIIRNSWSSDWANEGYYKVAGYPFNKWCIPEHIEEFPFRKNSSPYLIFIDVEDYPELIKYNKTFFKYSNFYLSRPLKYYNSREDKLINTKLFEENFNETIKDCYKDKNRKNCIKITEQFPMNYIEMWLNNDNTNNIISWY